MSTQPINLMGMERSGLARFFEDMGERSFRANQLTQWIYQRGISSFDGMTDLSKGLRSKLSDMSTVQAPTAINELLSNDGTRKWLLKMSDGNSIETVFIPEPSRGTLCVSSQVGCALNCTFCATARQGYSRNLSRAEIVGQLWRAREILARTDNKESITNVVMMGMGEPLLNFDNVVSALRLMIDDFAYGLSRRRVTLSTAGVVPGIDRLREECEVSLAVSLHAPNNDLRDVLVPLNRKYPIQQLLDACRRYVAHTNRARITFEYVMLDGVNDSEVCAKQLVSLLQDVPAKVNLIPFNQFENTHYRCSSLDTINRFRDTLMAAGIMTVTRKTRGDDIDAACGQLAGLFRDRTRRSQRIRHGEL